MRSRSTLETPLSQAILRLDTASEASDYQTKKWGFDDHISFFATASKMRLIGIGILSVGISGAIAIVCVSLVHSPSYNLILGGGFPSIGFIILGIFFCKKTYWKDREYCAERRNEIVQYILDHEEEVTELEHLPMAMLQINSKRDLISREDIALIKQELPTS